MTILVLGASGQLATHLKEQIPEATLWGRNQFDLANAAALPAAVATLRPSAIVNAAGYTAVDKAESEPDIAWRINVEGTAMAARAASALDIPLIHVSTDYVFDGAKQADYETTDAPRPLSVYGMTKLGGELAVQTLCRRTWILRTSWVFSEHGANFVKTMLRLAEKSDCLKVVADQRGRPTYAGDLARVIVALLRHRGTVEQELPYGIYNAVGGKVVTWHEFARAIFSRAVEQGLLKRPPNIAAISTADYATVARRPANSVLRPSEKLERALAVSLDWERGLDKTLAFIRSHRT